MKSPVTLFWFRRDLRLEDNAALYHALKSPYPVLPLFIFDRHILDKLRDRCDARVTFIYDEICRLHKELKQQGSTLLIFHSTPEEVYLTITSQYDVKEVWANRDYEPYAQKRDREIHRILGKKNIPFREAKDQVIFEKNEILKDDGKPYTVFTPYSRKWKSKLGDFFVKPYPTETYFSRFFPHPPSDIPLLESMHFQRSSVSVPSREVPLSVIESYDQTRDIPGINGTSRLSVHLRFGTLSIRKLADIARKKNEKWLNELIWRDFYQMILFHFPETPGKAFKPSYDRIEWVNDETAFQAWCEGKTGYPLVDAGMRELNATGYMHNRVRMVVASFLTKHLLTDWRWGESYFAEKLLDFDLASNVGGWQWTAGCGCDAAPYFRIFNPAGQQEKFDPEQKYIRRWIPEYGTPAYPEPMIDHKYARNRCLETFKIALKE